MFKSIVGRIVSMLLVLWVIITVTFVLMHAIPGGPFTAEKALPEAVMKNIEARYRLNDPLPKQYVDYWANLLRGDLGPSFKYESRSVNEIIAEGFPVSAELGLVAVSLSVLIGIPAGMAGALYQNRWPDHLVMLLATVGISVPSFILATLLIFCFALWLRILPAAMWGAPEYVILPALALAGMPTAFIARLTRSSMLEVLAQDYIRTARAKGIAPFTILWRHALKNALLPVVTYLGPMIAAIFTGSFVIESIFAIPGLGR
nr:ABC transporter permease [Negativicutes bacterium]